MADAMNAWTPTDATLMAQLADGRMDALGPLYDRYGRMVKSVLLRLDPGLPVEQCDDLAQDVFLTLAETAPRYQEQQRLKSWLCGIAARTLQGRKRRWWTRKGLLLRFGREGAGVALGAPPRPDDQAGARQALHRAMADLPDSLREVLVLVHLEGLTAEEVAAALEIFPKTVWTRLHRARTRMRTTLEEGS